MICQKHLTESGMKVLFKLKRLGLSGKYYRLIKSFLRNRHQRVVLNGQSSKWSSIKAGVPQESILGPLLFLAYINDLPNGLLSNSKLFADDTSIFSVVKDHLSSSNKLNEDLSKISQWGYQWKMSFNPDVSKQAQEVIFSRKKNIGNHPAVFFNNLPINRKSTQKHLGLSLDEKLNFSEHINEKRKKVTKSINLLRNLNLTLPRSSRLIIYKSFIRPHLDCGDIVYDQPNNSSLSEKIESLQYNAALGITGAIKGSSKEKLYQELGFESLKDRRWMRKLCYLYKVISSKRPSCLYDMLPPSQRSQRNQGFFQPLLCRTEIFKNSFLPYTINEWNKLDPETRRIDSYVGFRKKLLSFIKPMENKSFSIYDHLGIKLLNRLRVDCSHLNEHKFRHKFADTLNPLCSCSLETESTAHFFLRCRYYSNIRITLMNELNDIDNSITSRQTNELLRIILYGDCKFKDDVNKQILIATIQFIKNSNRFNQFLI